MRTFALLFTLTLAFAGLPASGLAQVDLGDHLLSRKDLDALLRVRTAGLAIRAQETDPNASALSPELAEDEALTGVDSGLPAVEDPIRTLETNAETKEQVATIELRIHIAETDLKELTGSDGLNELEPAASESILIAHVNGIRQPASTFTWNQARGLAEIVHVVRRPLDRADEALKLTWRFADGLVKHFKDRMAPLRERLDEVESLLHENRETYAANAAAGKAVDALIEDLTKLSTRASSDSLIDAVKDCRDALLRVTQASDQGTHAGAVSATKTAFRALREELSLAPASMQLQLEGRTVNVVDFRPLTVRLDIMDETTASHLYGRQTAKQFHVLKVRFHNALAQAGSEELRRYEGHSVLAYRASLELAVEMDKRPDKKSDTEIARDRARSRTWVPVTADDLKGHLPAHARAHETPLNGQPRAHRHRLLYRPYSREMMLDSQAARAARSPRSLVTRGFRSAAMVGEGVGQLTEFGADFGDSVSLLSSTIIPGIDGIWPTMAEEQRQSLLRDSMDQIEEIAYGADLEKVVFVPKRPFRGYLRGHLVRVSEVHTNYFQVLVAVTDKKRSVTIGGTRNALASTD